MDSVEVKIYDVSLTNVGFAVFLKAKEGTEDRMIPIFIGPLETHAITSILDGVATPRPMTHDLLVSMLQSLGAIITKVTIDEIKDSTFYAKISLRKDEEILTLDARPSDSIAIALRMNAPIFINQSVFDEAGIHLKDEDFKKDKNEDEPKVPKTQLEMLEEALNTAVKHEEYETAAKLRDQIRKIIESS